MFGYNMKEVRFDLYCPTCKHKSEEEANEPCAECLCVCARENSHKPYRYEQADNKNKTSKKARTKKK